MYERLGLQHVELESKRDTGVMSCMSFFLNPDSLKCMFEILFFHHFIKIKSFCDFLFASLDDVGLPKWTFCYKNDFFLGTNSCLEVDL